MDDRIKQLILNNMSLIPYVINKSKLPFEYDDLYGAAAEGLIRAATAYDDNKGYKFSTFAAKCIHNQILKYAKYNSKHLNIASCDTMIFCEDDNTLNMYDIYASDESIEDSIISKVVIDDILHNMNHILSDKDATIIQLIYGLNDNEPKSQEAVANILHTSQPYVCRRLHHALQLMRNYIEPTNCR